MNNTAKVTTAPPGTRYFTRDREITREEAVAICRNNERLWDLAKQRDDFTLLSGVTFVMVVKKKEDWQ